MKNPLVVTCLTFLISSLLIVPQWVIAQEKGGEDLRAAVQNPISSLVSLPFKFTFDYGAGNGDGTILNIQPVYPVTKGDWNYVSRLILPLASVDGPISTPENGLPVGSSTN